MKRHPLLPAGLLATLLLALASVGHTEEGAEQDCVTLSSIDHTDVIDDRHIAFYLRNGDILVNELDRTCPRLDEGRPFGYRTSISRLCHVDMITVLERTAGGLTAGASCGLGKFTPVDEDYIAALKGEDDPATVTVTEIKPEE